jgi:Flp pilus assembly secretin CpaC
MEQFLLQRMINFWDFGLHRRIGAAVMVAGALTALVGCGEMFNKKPTEIESRAILNELGRIRENPNVINPMPDVYRGPARRMAVEGGVKVFYFAQNTPVATLAENVKELGFNVSQNPSTNQIILHCPDDDQADKVLEYLKQVDVAPIQVNIDCLILERFGDVTKDWESSLLIDNLFGTGVALGENKTPNPIFPGASIRESARSNFGFNLGYNNNAEIGHRVRMGIDMLVSRGYLKILLNPSLETLNGKKAKVEIKDNAPIPKYVTVPKRSGSGDIDGTESYLLTDYQPVADSLEVTPYVFADGSIGLKTTIIIGSKSKPEGVTQTSIITERSIEVAENRIDPGKSLVIGGMRKSENRSVVRGVPFLKDIPILGVLFSSKDFEENATEIIFILTPSISSGGTEYSQMAATLREKQRMVEPEDGLSSVFTDPLGTDVYTKHVREEAHKSEAERIRAQRETIDAQREAGSHRRQAELARQDAAQLKAQAERAQRQAEEARKQIELAKAAATEARQQTEAEKLRISGLEQEMQKLKLDAEKATQDAQKAAEQAQRDEQKAAELDAQAKQAMQTAEKARQEAEQSRLQTEQIEKQRQDEAAAEAAQKAKAEAEEKARLEAEQKAKEEAENKARLDAEEKARQEAAAAAAAQPQPAPTQESKPTEQK